MMEEVDKEKALKQVAEANLNGKNLGAELGVAQGDYDRECPGSCLEGGRTATNDASLLQCCLEVKLAEASNVVSAQDKELTDLKETLNNCEQVYYNMGFKDT